MSEQRSGKICLAVAAVLRRGYRDKREEVGTKKEMMVSWTWVGMGQREERVVGFKIYIKGRSNQIC